MVGVIVSAFGDFVGLKCSAAAQEALADKLGGQRVIATQNYPDEMVLAIIAEVASADGKGLEQILEEFGYDFVRWAQPRYKVFFASPSARDFLLGMTVAHQSVRSFNLEAAPPAFRYEQPSSDELVMIYDSPRKLCSLMRGLIAGVADHYGERVAIREPSCQKRGGKECRFELKFSH